METTKKINRLLVANRGEIAIRVFRAATELGIKTIAIYSREDRFALHRFKSDESWLVGEGKGPIEAYLDIEDIIRIAKETQSDAIHPGYGFLAENPEFAERCIEEGIVWVGPTPEVMRSLGNKVSAREMARKAGTPIMPATGPLPYDADGIKQEAALVGYPMMLKASWGGGGRGMRVVEKEEELIDFVDASRREAKAAFGNDEVYLEKLVRRARHVEVQILGDKYGNICHLFERDCSVQRRNQKVVERAPAPYLNEEMRMEICEAAVGLGRTVGYCNAGTVEFLLDMDTNRFFFMEVNPRIQVEHTVTEVVTGIDIVKAQMMIAQGAKLGSENGQVPVQENVKLNGHAIQCRVTSEDPENNFIPDYGRITAYRGATGYGVRLDGGSAYTGALITRHYDSLLEKVTVWAPTTEEAILRMNRTLSEFRIRGVATNLQFLETLISHPDFINCAYTTRFIDDTPALFKLKKRQNRATRLLSFLADVIINGNPEVQGRAIPQHVHPITVPHINPKEAPDGTKQILEKHGAEGVAKWMLEQKRLLITDTSFRDAHQSLLATRLRTHDMELIAPTYAATLPNLFSVDCWGGATFDVAMRFLKECPWERLTRLREDMPNLLLQMLLRSSNGVGYTNYPDNVVKYFIQQAAETGIDLFRVFDSLNWVENMRPAMDAVIESGKICEASICYSGDILDPSRTKYNLKYYVNMAKELEAAGAHILGIKDMAGLLKPAAAKILIGTLKQETGLPIHFHTHDTSGISAASILAASEAGVDAVDAAMDSLSGLTSQPNLGAISAALKFSERDTELEDESLGKISDYWEHVRRYYVGFESEIRSGTSEVYLHEMPGGQYTNLRLQARALGIEDRWREVAKAYAQVNELFGDVIKVTPSSKVVGDMALMMVTSSLTKEDIVDPDKEISFPESVISFFRGDLGQPHNGFPAELQKKVLKGEKPLTSRPGASLPPVDLAQERVRAQKLVYRQINDQELASYLMYSKVFVDYANFRRENGNVSVFPTMNYFYGMEQGEELSIHIEKGKTLIIRFQAVGEPDEEGNRNVFFELNGQPRPVKTADRSLTPAKEALPKADDSNPGHIGSPMPGLVINVSVTEKQEVQQGDVLLAIEAMKMETVVTAEISGIVEKILTPVGAQVDTKDLMVIISEK